MYVKSYTSIDIHTLTIEHYVKVLNVQKFINKIWYAYTDHRTLCHGFKGILSTSCVIFSYPKFLSISVLTFIKWRLNTELLMNTLRNIVFSTKKADHRYRKLINYALTWARPTLFIYLFLCQWPGCCSMDIEVSFYKSWGKKLFANRLYLKDVK